MNSDTDEEIQRSIALGETAFALIRAHKTSAFPKQYDIWFNYALGHSPALKRSVDECLQRGAVTNRDIEELHDQHLSTERLKVGMDQVGSSLLSESEQVLAMLQANLGDAASFNTVLSSTASKLTDSGGTPAEIQALVEGLLHATRDMERSNRELESRLQSSHDEIVGLHAKLATITAESLSDALTGLANRKAFDTELGVALKTADTAGMPLSLILTDIDHFKRFNDTYGHQTGDQVLRLVAQALKVAVKGADTAARYGGEEFAIILPGTTMSGARAIAEKIRHSVMSKEMVKRSTREHLGRITMSAGVASYRQGDDAASLVQRADQCLYAAKRAGRNCVIDESACPDSFGTAVA